MTLQGIMLSYFSKKGDKERDDKIPFPTGVTCFTDISYGPYGKENWLDVYLPEGTEYAVNLIQPAENLEGAINLLEPETVAYHTERLYHQPNPVFDEKIAPCYDRIAGDVKRLRKQ